MERYQLPVNLVSELWDGMNIRYQVSIAGSNMLDVGEEYRNADILLIQEYGNHYETTYDDLCELIENYCKDDVIVYYYTTEWDYPARYLQKISDDARIHILDFGSVQNKLNEMKAPGEESMYDYLHLKNGLLKYII